MLKMMAAEKNNRMIKHGMNTLSRIVLCTALLLPVQSAVAAETAPQPAAAQTVDSLQDAKKHSRQEFVNGMAQMTLSILQDPKKPYSERRQVLRRAFCTVVDIEWIARFVLGRAWNNATPEEKDKYVDLYRSFLTDTYVSNFGENQEHRIKDIQILGIQDAEDNDFLVNTYMKLANADDVKVVYRVSDHNGKYKVIDIIIENVSLLNTHRSEFAQLAASKGVNAVITQLETMVRDFDHAMLKVSMN